MAIGTTVKLGLDASAVKKGFSLLPRMFKGAMKGLNWAGAGAAMKAGAGVTDLLGKTIMAIPDGIRDMMDYVGAMNDLRVTTGMTIKELMTLEEAMRLSGAEGDIGKMISTFSKNMHSAVTEQGSARDAINKLGFRGSDFRGKKVNEAFRMIGMAAKDFRGDMGELDQVLSDLFGGRMSYKMKGFFADFDGNWNTAAKNSATFAERLEKEAGNIDAASEALGRYRMRWLQLMEIIASAIGLGSGGDAINAAFDWLNPERVRGMVEAVKGAVVGAFEWFKNGEYKTLFQDMGRWIGDGLKASMGEMFNPSSWFKPFHGKEKPATPDRTTSQLIDLNRQQARSLAKIERSGFPATLA